MNELNDPGRYRGITMPTLLLVGSESVEHPFQDTTRSLAEAMPNASVRVLPGQRHLAQLLAPSLLIEAIQSWITS